MLKELPKHKGTDKLQADLKSKISRLKKELASPQTGAAKRSQRIPRQGAGRAVIIGGPNSGKSQLLATYTQAQPTIAEYPFSTVQPQPGMMPWQDVMVQLIDTPPITADVYDANTQSLIRGADLVLLMCDLGSDEGGQQVRDVWRQINQTKTRLGRETSIDEQDLGITYTQTFFLPNKVDLSEAGDRLEFFQEYIEFDLEIYAISALQAIGTDDLRDAIYASLGVIRVYTKTPTQKVDECGVPFTLRPGDQVLDLAELVHKDVARNFKFAKVWGSQVHDGTQVKGDYVVNDGDVIELHV